MKKLSILSCAMATIIGITAGNLFIGEFKGTIAYASGKPTNLSVVSNEEAEKAKAEFAYEMAQITAKIVSSSELDIEKFKAEYAYATAKVTAKVMPMIPIGQQDKFAYQMSKITTKVVSDPNLSIEKAKANFAYEVAQLTTKIIFDADVNSGDRAVLNPGRIDPNSANTQSATKPHASSVGAKVPKSDKQGLTPDIYEEIIDDLMNVGNGQNQPKNKVNLNGNIRIHHAANNGDGRLGQDSSGIRVYLGANSEINKDWQAYALLEGQKRISNYNNFFKLSRLYAAGKVGKSSATIGSFGYLMADGNIYDSGYKGARFDFTGPLKYTFSHGQTDYTKETYVATAKYSDYDYDLEAGVYHYKKDSGASEQNTILTIGGNYNFSNFGVGAMYLDASLKDSRGDSDGYVFSFKYGDLKTYRPGTYDIFAKYYNQSSETYIAHGMNGLGGRMQGFKGYGLGMNYTLAQNFTAGIEYYNLSDKISREKSQSWWSQLTHYF
ncbi:S-layer protein [Dendrosporobacter sp. 1207_IL3150]|uniref:S-layer protein n=1 Tax=Dendrosporobacter sp. 1207_IL3150 TaxID=3084054 RepID=UPI002FDB120D